MNKFKKILVYSFAALCAAWLTMYIRSSFPSKADYDVCKIKIGDTKETVLRVMGEPAYEQGVIEGDSTVILAYYGSSSDEITIHFDKGKVSRIAIPHFYDTCIEKGK